MIQKASDALWTPAGADALKYLTEKRGISEDVLKVFKIGFVPLGVNYQLTGRIITPIFDVYGDAVAVSTRHLYKEKSKSFWHEDFDKSFYLYGLQEAKSHILKAKKAIVVEGEFDVAFLHSNGIRIAVGTCGNALGLSQIALLSRYCEEIYMLYDADKGGEMALQRCKELYNSHLKWALKLIPMRMPNGNDPDDFVRYFGRDGLVELMKLSKEKFDKYGCI